MCVRVRETERQRERDRLRERERERERERGGGREREKESERERRREMERERARERERGREREGRREKGREGKREREIITLTADRAKRICLPEISLQWQQSKLSTTSSHRQTTESLISLLSTLVRRRANDWLSLVRKNRQNCPLCQPRLLVRTLDSPPLPL